MKSVTILCGLNNVLPAAQQQVRYRTLTEGKDTVNVTFPLNISISCSSHPVSVESVSVSADQ